MPSYLHPGVYVEEIPSGSKPIEGVSTSVTAFVGDARRGPIGVANLIGKFDDYVKDYGGIASEDDHMGLAIQSFYLNGGGAAYICRLAGNASKVATIDFLGEGLADGGPTASPVLVVNAKNEGEWGNGIYVQIVKPDINSLTFDLNVGHLENGEFKLDESFSGLSLRENDDNYAFNIVNEYSTYVLLGLGQNAESNYQAAKIVGGRLDSANLDFKAKFLAPKSMSLEINGLGLKLINIDPASLILNGDHTHDGQAIADAIESAVNVLGTDPAYQSFVCEYNEGGPQDRFVLTSIKQDSNATIQVYGGDLAQFLHLDPEQKAVLEGSDVTLTDFNDSSSGLPNPKTSKDLIIKIDNYPESTITLDVAALGLDGNNENDGEKKDGGA